MAQQQQDPQLTLQEDESLSDSTTVNTPPSEQVKLISRIGSIPLIHDITNKTFIGKFAVSSAQTAFTTVNKYKPNFVQSYYEYYLQPHVEKVDAYGCRSLDLIQEKYPAVNTSTSDIIHSITTARRMTPVVDTLEAAINKYLPADNTKERNITDEKNQAKRAYDLINNATSRITQRLVAQKQNTQEKLLQVYPQWLLEIAHKQIDIVRQQYQREDIKSFEKAKQVVLALQEQLTVPKK